MIAKVIQNITLVIGVLTSEISQCKVKEISENRIRGQDSENFTNINSLILNRKNKITVALQENYHSRGAKFLASAQPQIHQKTLNITF
ncbi:hypothetical protein [Dickeya chrysanthemi]|uniref:hypothetical protein n=1 Tax=Dickeya chrysanthemi TaxID=556 RepID=UPI001E42443C|nr:hypothetical protein [Dickeya chrysanthemi]